MSSALPPSTGKLYISERKTTLPVGTLLSDLSVYPRNKLDTSNVSDLVEAIDNGASVPAIIAEDKTLRIVDGWHRQEAYRRLYGAEHKIEVTLRRYANEGNLFADAVALNRSHGRKLNSADLVRSFNRLREYGWDDTAVAVVVRMKPPKVTKLTARVAVRPAGEPVPLKFHDRHLQGQTVSDAAAEFLTNHRAGINYGRLCRQIIEGLEHGVSPDDEKFWTVARELHTVLTVALDQRDT